MKGRLGQNEEKEDEGKVKMKKEKDKREIVMRIGD
jgi:hypothetical protein